MKIKTILPYLFLFLLFYINLIPNVQIGYQTLNQGKISYSDLALFQLLSSFQSNNVLYGFLYISLLFIFVIFLKYRHCQKGLITLFSIGYIIHYIFRISIANFHINSLIYDVRNNDFFFYASDILAQFLDLGIFTFIVIIFILILKDVKYGLQYFTFITISTALLIIAIGVEKLYILYNTIFDQLLTNTYTIMELIILILVLLFKLSIILEVFHMIHYDQNLSEQT